VVWLLVASAFAGAALAFIVEPMVAKLLLPVYGGSSAVWTTALVFFQSMLVAGYAWAHVRPGAGRPRPGQRLADGPHGRQGAWTDPGATSSARFAAAERCLCGARAVPAEVAPNSRLTGRRPVGRLARDDER